MTAIPSMRPEPDRDSYGRYLLPHPESGRRLSWTRATTLKGALQDKEGLIGWKQRLAAAGMAMRPELASQVLELHEQIRQCGDDWRAAKDAKAALAEVVAELHHAAGGDEGSERGTQAHTLTEYADAGRLDEVHHLATDAELADLQAYLDTCNAAGIVRPAEYIERIVVNTQVETAGTFDRLVRLPDGRLVVADIKSQKDFAFGYLDVAAQLGQYVWSDAMWDDETKSWEPLPAELDKATGLVMHVPVGKATCELIEIDLVQGWEAAQLAHQVRDTRQRGKVMGRPYRAPAPRHAADAHLLYLIRTAPTVPSLEGLWRRRQPGDVWTARHITAAAARKTELLTTQNH
jgi:hypothetical protein